MGLQGSEGMSIRISRNLNICMLMSTRLRMGDTCNGKLKVYLYAYRIAKFHVFCKIIEFVCKNNIFNIVTTLGESASGQQWQIDIGTCTVRTSEKAAYDITLCIYDNHLDAYGIARFRRVYNVNFEGNCHLYAYGIAEFRR